MKPALSPMVTSTLPSRAASASTSFTTEGSVTTVRTTSTSFITGAGLKKCIPMTLPGRPVVIDNSVTDRLEVLVARMVSGGQILSSAEKTSALSSILSGIASTTSSATTRSSMLVENRIRDRISSRSAASSLPRATALPVDCSTCARPRCSAESVTSTAVTDSPARASTSAMPAPMVPSPTTPTSVSSLATVPTLLPSGDRRQCPIPDPAPTRLGLPASNPTRVEPASGGGRSPSSEETRGRVVGALEDGVVDRQAVDPAVTGQHPGLGLDLLGGEDALDRGEQRVAVEQLEVPGQLLDTVDLPAPLDLHRHGDPIGVPAQQVDRADRGRVLPADQRPALAEGLHVQRQQPLQLGLHAVLLQARVDAQVVPVVVLDRLDRDDQLLARPVGHRPGAGPVDQLFLERARRGHPVQRLVGPVVGMDRHRAVGLDQQQPGGRWQVSGEPPDVVHGATGDDQTHGRRRYPDATDAPSR